MPIPTPSRALRATCLTALVLAVALLPTQMVIAADVHWNGSIGSNWTNSNNWTTGVPSLTDNAVFDGTFTNQPTPNALEAFGGLWMKTGVGQNVVIGGTGTLQLAGNTINGTARSRPPGGQCQRFHPDH